MSILILLVLVGIMAILLAAGSVQMRISNNVAGITSVQETYNAQGNTGQFSIPTILPAQPAILTVRTNNTSGSLTMNNTNHGITTGQRVDLYWAGGQAYGATVGTVSGTTVPITAVSGGSVLPSATTPINVGIPVQTELNFVGNNLQAICCSANQPGYFVFDTAVPADAYAIFLANPGQIWVWKTEDPVTNPFAGVTIATVWMSTSYITANVVSTSAQVVTN